MSAPDTGRIFLQPLEKRIKLFNNVDGILFRTYSVDNICKVKKYLPFFEKEENKLWCHEFLKYFVHLR